MWSLDTRADIKDAITGKTPSPERPAKSWLVKNGVDSNGCIAGPDVVTFSMTHVDCSISAARQSGRISEMPTVLAHIPNCSWSKSSRPGASGAKWAGTVANLRFSRAGTMGSFWQSTTQRRRSAHFGGGLWSQPNFQPNTVIVHWCSLPMSDHEEVVSGSPCVDIGQKRMYVRFLHTPRWLARAKEALIWLSRRCFSLFYRNFRSTRSATR
jgi:hypothetical protein